MSPKKKKKTKKKTTQKQKSIVKMVKNVCENCGHTTIENHCKLICPKCGASRDCSDP